MVIVRKTQYKADNGKIRKGWQVERKNMDVKLFPDIMAVLWYLKYHKIKEFTVKDFS